MHVNVTPATGARNAEGGTSIRTRLLLLAVAGILPLAAMSGWALLALTYQQRAQVEQAGLEIARALSTAVDTELQHSTLALEAIATALQGVGVAAFREPARRVVLSQPTWWALVLHDPAGTPVLHTGYPPGEDLPRFLERESFERVLRERRPVVGRLSGQTALRIPVRVPIVRNDQLVYVLTALVEPNGMLDVVNRQRLPADWVVSVFDATGARVARSRSHQEHLGQAPSASLQALMDRGGHEGHGMTTALEGDRIHTAYSRSVTTGFAVAIGMPPSFVDAGAFRSLATYGGGLLLSLALGALAALVVARSVVRPIGELHAAAQALGRRAPVRAPATAIEEIRQVGESLVRAAEERARSEGERDALLHREQEARASAEAVNKAKDEFLAMLGHELRNPLGAIASASRLIDDPRVDAATVARARAIVARQVDHMARLTDDLLEAGRALTGKIVLKRAPMNLGDAAADVLRSGCATSGEERRVVEQLEPVWIDADPTRVEQIVGNLLANAVKYSGSGGTITVSVRQEGDEAVLRVADDGIGMDPALVARVFEPFVQGTRELDRQQGGLGIGLTLVRRLVELHGGSVEARSEGPGRGSEFVVRLPAAKAPEAPDVPSPPPPASAGRDILLVEDNDDARVSLCQLLELDGHTVTAARDAASALAHVRAAPPDVALIDLGLPGMDGYELARRIRAEVGDATRLVALTGYGLPADRSRSQAAGFDVHLVKPIDIEALAQVLRRS